VIFIFRGMFFFLLAGNLTGAEVGGQYSFKEHFTTARAESPKLFHCFWPDPPARHGIRTVLLPAQECNSFCGPDLSGVFRTGWTPCTLLEQATARTRFFEYPAARKAISRGISHSSEKAQSWIKFPFTIRML
jgi:hypothetical protein